MGVNRKFDFRQAWKFRWDLSNVISGGIVFFWGGTCTPLWTMVISTHDGYQFITSNYVEIESILFFEFISITLIVVSLFHRLQNFLKPNKNAALFFFVIYIKIWNSSLTKFLQNSNSLWLYCFRPRFERILRSFNNTLSFCFRSTFM